MAAEAIVSVLLEQLASITLEEAQRQISLVGDVKKEVKKLTTNLQAIKAVLVDAEQRQVKEEIVKLWLDELKDMSYDMEDVLDEWNTEILKLQIEGGAHEIADHHVSKKKHIHLSDQEILLEAFQPLPPNLEVLKISKYNGRVVSPNWMMSLSTLKKLVLEYCANWKFLPPLGNWPYLESLEIREMHRIKRVSNEFLGVESGGASSSSSSSNIVIFPKLKSLRFYTMINWGEWDYGITRKDEEHITIMPHLQSLEFVYCPKLKVLPEELFQRTTLKELKINEWTSKILKERYEEWSSRRTLRRLNASN